MIFKNIKELAARKFFPLICEGRRKARRAGAMILCASLVAGSVPLSALTTFAAEDGPNDADYIYEIDSESFAAAIQEAVSEGDYLEQQLKFLGDSAEEYDELFKPDGTLYELNLDKIDVEKDTDRDKALSLRTFVRITEDIPLDETYAINGEEDIIFLLQNRTDEKVTAVIHLDDKKSEIIAVPEADDIEAGNRSNAENDEENIKDEPTDADERLFKEEVPVKGAGGSGASGGNGRNKSLNEKKNYSVKVGAIDEEDKKSDDVMIDNDGSDSAAGDRNTADSDVKSDKVSESDKKPDKAGNEGSDRNNNAGKDHNRQNDNKSDSVMDSNNEENSSISDGPESSDTTEDPSAEDSNDGLKEKKNRAHSSNNNKSEHSANIKESDNKEKSSSNSGNFGDKENSGEKSASVSIRGGNMLAMAIASDSNAEKATPSDASSTLNGTVYDPVRIGKRGAVAFVTTAEDLGLKTVDYVFYDEVNAYIYSLTLDALCDAVEEEVREGTPMEEDEERCLYEIFPEIEDEAEGLTLRTFVKINKINEVAEAVEIEDFEGTESEESSDTSESADLITYSVNGEEEICFLFINETEDELKARVQVSTSDEIYESPEIVIARNGEELSAEALSDDFVYDDGCMAMSIMLYDTTTVDGRPAVSFVTSLKNLGVDYGIKPLDATASTADEFKTAIEAAQEGDTVTLGADITVEISDKDYVKIAIPGITVDLDSHTITVSGNSEDYYLFDIHCGGEFTLKNGIIDGGQNVKAAVSPVLSDMESNDVTLDGVTIQNFGSVSISDSGVVHATAGNLTVTNCTVQNNGASGIYANSCENLVITDSTFTGNTSGYGGGIFIENHEGGICIKGNTVSGNTSSYGGGISIIKPKGDICIKGNTVSGNTASYDGGGIYIFEIKESAGSGDFAVMDNKISDNEAGRNGGGICFETEDSVTATKGVGDFDLSGNQICNNKASSTSGYGGGIELKVDVEGREVVIKSGYIAKNEAYWGGGIDCSWSYCQSALHLYNAIITENTARARGGGIWACPNSETKMNVTFGTAIYGNIAAGRTSAWTYGLSGDDIRFEGKDTDTANAKNASGYAYVSPRALGGTLMAWYADDDSRGKRYESGDEPVDVTSDRYQGFVNSFGLHGELSEEGISLAEDDALLYIVDNTSETVGGGIATNTPVEFGSDGISLTVTANKVWTDEYGNEMTPEQTEDYSVDITLIRIDKDRGTKKELETVILNSENEWTHAFEDLPIAYMTFDDGEYTEHEYTYTVKESEVITDSAFTVKVETSEVTKNENGSLEQTVTVTNTRAESLVIGKQVQGSGSIPDDFSFKITLTDSGEKPYEGDINVTYYTKDSEESPEKERSDILIFKNGEAEVTLAADEFINLAVPAGTGWIVEELTDDADQTYVSLNGVITKATVASGTVADSTQVIFINSYREYYDIDEEIIPNMNDAEDRSSWEKSTSVNEYGALEFEMSITLPNIPPEDVKYGDFTMLFHNKLDKGLLLDAQEESDLHITIGGKTVDPEYYTVEVLTRDVWTIAPLALADNDECNFHVTVDLSRLYNETDIVQDEDLTGNTELMIYFYVDLEGQSMDGSYRSIVQYQIFDEGELLYTSSESIVYVYTYEIGINKNSSANGMALSGAVFGVYYDEACTQPVMRYGENYTVTSDGNGKVLFYGLAAGTYYLKELEAPEGFVLTQDVFKVVVGEEQVNISGSTGMSEDELDGAVFGVFYDEECKQQVSVDGVHYSVRSDSDGNIIFDGIAAGTYYLKQLEAAEGYELSTDVIKVTLDYDTFTYGYDLTVSNTPVATPTGGSGHGGSSGSGSGSSSSGGSGGSSGGSGVGGPGDSDGGSDIWDLILPSTGQGRAMLIGACAFVIAAMALVVLFWYRRRQNNK